MALPPRQSVSNTILIVDYVRRRGVIHYPVESVRADFSDWRLAIRMEARRIGLRISIVRAGGLVMVYDLDYEPSFDEQKAALRLIGTIFEAPADAKVPNFDESVALRRRARLRIVKDDAD